MLHVIVAGVANAQEEAAITSARGDNRRAVLAGLESLAEYIERWQPSDTSPPVRWRRVSEVHGRLWQLAGADRSELSVVEES